MGFYTEHKLRRITRPHEQPEPWFVIALGDTEQTEPEITGMKIKRRGYERNLLYSNAQQNGTRKEEI